MSHSRKNLKAKALSEVILPSDDQRIAKVLELRGAGVCEIEYPNGDKTLCQIPQKFHKLIWIKRGNYLLVREPKEGWNHQERKIRALVEHAFFPDQIKYLKREKLWPQEFMDPSVEEPSPSLSDSKDEGLDSEVEDDDLVANPNHKAVEESESEEEEDEEEEDDEKQFS